MMWLALSYFKGGKKFSMVEVLSGTLAGLAAITPGSGYVNP
jgi:ammonia channel protein AmtB